MSRTHLKNQLGSPLYVPSSLVKAKLPRADRVLCTAARSLPVRPGQTHVMDCPLRHHSHYHPSTCESSYQTNHEKLPSPSQRSTVWNMSVLVTPYFSEALRNWEICSICLKAAVELWIFFTGLSPVNRLLISSLRT